MSKEFLSFRGVRFKDFLREESTYKELETNIRAGFPDTKKRQHATNEVVVLNTQYLPYVPDSVLEVQAQSRSNSHNYQQAVQFSGVKFIQKPDQSNVTFTGKDNQQYHILPINLGQSTVKVKCTCLDFHWRFSMWNHTDSSLVGNPPDLYRKRTDRPPVNPFRVPGVCKHLIKLMDELKRGRIVNY